jgi:DNA-binding transcriptional LysR family regulator
MDLRHLRHLAALAHERHFARAAARVNLSQSAFSRSIKNLEQEVGMLLFDRNADEPALTPGGQFLVERARALLFDAGALSHDMQQFRDAEAGDLSFGSGPFAAATLIPELVATIRRERPLVSLRITVNNWRQLQDLLLQEEIEFFVADVRDIALDRRLHITRLGHQPGGFYVRQGHPLAGTDCTLADVMRYGILSVSLPDETKRLLALHLKTDHGARNELSLECDDFNLLKSVALNTDSVLAATHMALERELHDKSLLTLRPRELPSGTSQLGIARLAKRQPSPLAARLITAIASRLEHPDQAPEAHLGRTRS